MRVSQYLLSLLLDFVPNARCGNKNSRRRDISVVSSKGKKSESMPPKSSNALKVKYW